MKIKEKIIGKISDIFGITRLKEAVSSLYYYLNECISVEEFPKAKGELRQLQECDVLLLAILDKIFAKHHLTYWLSYGTLLGAIRHKGFIPWDDDLDISMPENDYNKVCDIIINEFKLLGIDGQCEINIGTNCLGVGIKHSNTGIYCDIFPLKEFYLGTNDLHQLQKIKNEAFKIFQKQDKDLRHFHINNIEGYNNYFCCSPFTRQTPFIYSKDDIFPLKRVKFEEFEFYVPNNHMKFLVDNYGYSCMQFPRYGILHHGYKDLPLYKWASAHNIDMGKMAEDLSLHLVKLCSSI